MPIGASAIPGDGAEPGFHAIELLLDVADVAQILVEDRAIGRAQRAVAASRFPRVTESSRLCFSFSRADALLGRAGLAEHPLEGHARVDADRQRAVSSRHDSVLKNVQGKPSQAPTAVPMSSVPTSIERSGVSPATLSAMYWSTVFFDWILPNASPVPSRSADRADAVQERRAGAEVDRLAPRRLHLADRHQLIAERLERLHHRLELRSSLPGLVRMPGVGKHAVRHVDRAEPERRGCAAVLACAVSAGTIASSSGSATAAPNVPRMNVRRDRCFFVMIMATVPLACATLLTVSAGSSARPHLERRALDDSR